MSDEDDDRCFCGEEMQAVDVSAAHEVRWCPECGRLRIDWNGSDEPEWREPCRAI